VELVEVCANISKSESEVGSAESEATVAMASTLPRDIADSSAAGVVPLVIVKEYDVLEGLEDNTSSNSCEDKALEIMLDAELKMLEASLFSISDVWVYSLIVSLDIMLDNTESVTDKPPPLEAGKAMNREEESSASEVAVLVALLCPDDVLSISSEDDELGETICDTVSDMVLTSEEEKLRNVVVFADSKESLVGRMLGKDVLLNVTDFVAGVELAKMLREEDEDVSSSEAGTFNEPSELEEIISSGVKFSKVETESANEVTCI